LQHQNLDIRRHAAGALGRIGLHYTIYIIIVIIVTDRFNGLVFKIIVNIFSLYSMQSFNKVVSICWELTAYCLRCALLSTCVKIKLVIEFIDFNSV